MIGEYRITCYYLFCLVILVPILKWYSLRHSAAGCSRERCAFWLAPSLSFPDWQARRRATARDRWLVLGKSVVSLLLGAALWHFDLSLPPHLSPWLQGYLAAFPFWLMLEMATVFFQLLWLPAGVLVPPLNRAPLAARSVADFWGRRWNRLFGDWLLRACFLPNRDRPTLALGATFLLSGLLHEFLVSLPYGLAYGESLLGWMLVYFSLQWLAIVIERRWLPRKGISSRLFCWLVVLGPAPLVLNPGTLHIFLLVR